MKAPQRLILAVIVGLAAGVAIGHFGLSAPASAPSVAVETPVRVVPTEPDPQEAILKALRKQVDDLERSLTYRMEQINELQHAVALRDERLAVMATSSVPATVTAEVADETDRTQRRPREGFEARLERMRTEAPEEYAEMQRRREEMQDRLTQLHQDRRAFLDAVDASRMTDAQREKHTRLLEAIETANAFRERLTSGDWSQLSAEQRTEGFTSMRTMGELYNQERRYILEETGRTYGEDGPRFADYIENVIENTSMMPNFGRGLGRGPRREDAPAPGAPPQETER